MYLKSLEISGFKSFAKKSVLDFKTPVTAIVGPNGSGKSNAAEAFRFVLGEQSVKSMRGKRGEDLIWNGSDEQPRAGRAVVKAVFDNSKRVFNLDFDEVSVERVVGRDGASEYLINGSQVRLRDILELLAGAHIGASGHHIISQGEADRVLSANIKERKAMIEDALGLKVYQYKRVESERKLEKTEENIKQAESLRREIAPHVRFLKKQVEKMGKAVEVRDKLISLYREYLKREKFFIDGEKVQIKAEKEPLLTRKEEIEREMKNTREILESQNKKDEKSEKLLQVEAQVRAGREEKDKLAREAGKIEGEIEATAKLIEKTLRKMEEGKNVIVPLSELEELLNDIESKNEIGEIKARIRDFVQNKRTPGEEGVVKEMENLVIELKKKKEEVENEIRHKEEELDKLDEGYKKIRQEIESEKSSERDAEREMLRLSSEEALVRSQIDVCLGREERIKIVETDFLREVEEAGVLVGQAVTGFATLELEILAEERHAQEERRREVERMKIRLEELGAAGGEETMKEYNDAVERDLFLEKELADLFASRESLQKLIEELEERLDVEFKEGIEKINQAFHNFFSLMFGGGEAKLEVIENKKRKAPTEEDLGIEAEENTESESGIDINVSLPKKRIKGLQMLSGGERALTSIALIFAISQVNPPPFIILDETDAALDEANSKKYGDMIESLSKYSQLILITHNRETMSRAGVIYGITMGSSGVSKLLSIAFDEAVAVAK